MKDISLTVLLTEALHLSTEQTATVKVCPYYLPENVSQHEGYELIAF